MQLVVIPAGEIQPNAFNGNRNLKIVKLGNKVTSIGEYAFNWCTSLTGDLIIPSSVTTIGNGAFYDCSGINGKIETKGTVESIHQYSFSGCKNVTQLILKGKKIEIGSQIFMNAPNLEKIKIECDELKLGQEAFEYCDKLDSIDINGSIMIDFSERASFCQCKKLSKITIYGGNITFNHTFKSCDKLVDVYIEGNNLSFDSDFVWGYGLKNVTIKGNNIRFGQNVFEGCNKLEMLSIIGYVENGFGGNMFAMCSSLSKVKYSGTKAEWNALNKNTGNECLEHATIYCSDGDIEPTN